MGPGEFRESVGGGQHGLSARVMAPALPLAPRNSPDLDTNALEHSKSQCHGRQVLAPVGNLATAASSDDLALATIHTPPNGMKDSHEMEQMLVDLSSNDLLQVMKTFENNNDALSTGDADSIFPLDLPDTVETESESPEDKIRVTQVRLERRCAFLLRRLRILQARAIGKRVSEEVVQTFEKCTRGARKDGGGRPMGLKALLKRVETTAALQASAASKTVVGPKYYNPGTSKGDASKSASVGIASGTLTGLEDTAGALKSHLSLVKQELDSDATASSSGAESNDEAVLYNNPHQQPMPIEKRALWSWQRERASIASRWSWLQAQVQELEYKIRQHNDLHKQVREAKGPVEFEGSPAAYEGSLPGADPPDDDPSLETCARVRPLRRETFKKRKLLQMHNLHIATNKAAKPSDIRCRCRYPEESCPVCTGRPDPTLPLPPPSTLTPQQRIALVDPSYHPVLSDIHDVSPWSHLEALCSRPWFRPRAARGGGGGGGGGGHAARGSHHAPPPRPPSTPQPTPKPSKRHKLKRGRPPLSRKIKDRERDEDHGHERSRCRTSTESRSWRRQSYDIDNIVIPQSVAANTRPQILEYKEIITPKWRVMEIPEVPMNNGISNSKWYRMSIEEEEEEDISEPAVASRHRRAEHRERSRYQHQRRALQPSHLTHPPPPPPPPPPHDVHDYTHAVEPAQLETPPTPQSLRPYSPRQFPLPDYTYEEMLSAMPDGFRPSSREQTPPLDDSAEVTENAENMEDDSSTLSPVSPTAYEGDDPDDIEWDPSVEKTDRRKSSFR